MVTLVIAAGIGKPIQSASVKEGMNCLPELTGPCVLMSAGSLRLSADFPGHGLILRQAVPCGGLQQLEASLGPT